MGNFKEDLTEGEKGEELVYKLLCQSSQNKTVMDVRNDIYFQDLDIDFLAEKHSGIVIKYEVKTDRLAHKTGNLVYEETTSGNIGCLAKSHADYILYYLSQSNELYGFWLIDMRNYIEETKPQLVDMGDNAEGYLLKISDLISKKIIKKVLTY